MQLVGFNQSFSVIQSVPGDNLNKIKMS